MYAHLLSTSLVRLLVLTVRLLLTSTCYACQLFLILTSLISYSEGRRRKWVFPALKDIELDGADCLKINGLSPYWFDAAEGSAVHNTVDMQSLFLLTGPNGGGKSSLLRSICAASLLGICGLMVPAESASIPYFDAIMLHMKSYDSPADGKSSFQVFWFLVLRL